ncbi:MAG TPA: serine hydrolase domain-containing protein [Chryseolinea sp.]|nr:serine hydrolase domain-containing protein [Chryseolinea sp.]
MRYWQLLITLICLSALMPRCAQDQSATAPAQSLSGYKEAAFGISERKQQLKDAAGIIDTIYRTYAAANHYPAMAYGLVMDGELIVSGAVGYTDVSRRIAASTKSMFRIASMTKSFTAMAIVKLRDEGQLNLDDLASKYIPELRDVQYPTNDAPAITIRNLLTMTAGFPEDNPWGDRQLADKPEELHQFIQQGISFSNVPSKEFEYSNMGYAMLGEIVTVVSGKPFQRYITEKLLQPLGMNDTRWEYSEVDPGMLALGYSWDDAQWKTEPLLHDGIYGAMGGLITTIEDFSKYVNFHLQAWPSRNGPATGPLQRSSLREMHKPWQFRGLYADERRSDGTSCPATGGYGYGLGWRRNCDGIERVSHSGGLPGFGSEFRFYPDYGFGIISFANLTYASAGSANSQVMDTLMHRYHFAPRSLPASDTLRARRDQVMTLLKDWSQAQSNDGLQKRILAENFYLDASQEQRMGEAKALVAGIGTVVQVGEMTPENQLRGKFRITGDKGIVEVFFTLTPERVPRIQQLDWELISTGPAAK